MKGGNRTYLLLTSGLLTAILIFFWSCTDVSLVKNPEALHASSVKPDISVCSYADTRTLTDDLRVTFVIDMSGSNILTTNGKAPTDRAGDRLTAVAEFINAHPNLKYKIVPFSSQVLSVAQCNTGFDVAGVAATQLVTLLNLQRSEMANPSSPVREMKETWYTVALDCAASAIFAEKAALAADEFNRSHFKVFFVTDGQPTDFDRLDQMTASILDMKLLAASAASYQLVPVFYGPLATPAATETLRQLGEAGNWSNSAFPNDIYYPLVVSQVNQINYDRFLSYSVTQQFKIVEFNLVNLSLRPKNSLVYSDSDSDGIADHEDPDPVNRRSNGAGLMDGICQSLGGPLACQAPTNCKITLSNRFSMTECDLESLGLGNVIDQDGDLIPDFIEQQFALNPLINDAHLNMDGDDLTNLEEIHAGSRPDDPDPLPKTYRTDWRRVLIDAETSDCPGNQDLWQIQVAQVPTIPTAAYTEPLDSKWEGEESLTLSHLQNENLVFAYYIQQAVNGTEPKRFLRAKMLRVLHGSPQQIRIAPQEFVDLGEVGVAGALK